MNIVVNARFLSQPITGTQRFAIELCRDLKKYIPEIVFLSPDNIIHTEIADEFGVKVMGKFKRGLLWEQVDLPIFLKKNNNPLLLNFCNTAPVYYKNNIVTVLDLSFKLHPEWFSKKYSRLFNIMSPRVAKNARKVITISEYSKCDIVKHYNIPEPQIEIVYPRISDKFLNVNVRSSENLYGKYILAVSSLDPRKNFKGLIQAFKYSGLIDTKLVIVGSEHKVFADNSLKEIAKGDPNIIFTGYVNDDQLVNLYKNALLFVYPSFFEGFGIPPLEAMACGCPTLVSNTTSLPEVCGDASIYVDPYNLDSIKNGIIEAVFNEKLRNELVLKGYNQLQKFHWEISAKRMLSVVRDLSN